MGLTKWDVLDDDVTRSSFLKEAVSKSYKAREDAAAGSSSQESVRSCGASATSSSSLHDDHSFRSRTNSSGSDQSVQEQRLRQAAFAAELRNQRSQPRINATHTSFADERPISSYTVVMNGLEQQARPPMPPMPPMPDLARFNQPVFYMQPSTRPGSGSGPGPVLDPVDRAIDMIVRELGFNENDAKWALKITDTGEGIDTNAAVALLMRERQSQRKSSKRGLFSSSFSSTSSSRSGQGSLLSSVISEESAGSGWRWA